MTDHELEQRIRTAVEHAAPDRLDKILSSCGQQNLVAGTPSVDTSADGRKEGVIIDMEAEKKKKSGGGRKRFAAIAAAAAMLVLCIGGYGLFRGGPVPAIDSVVMLDVNPSLSIAVDAEETVLSVEALNEDAAEVLGSMELEGTSLEVAVNAIIGSMLQKGYLGDLQNSILVSVENDDAARGEALQQKVMRAISDAAQNGSLDAAILSQLISADNAALAELAAQYQISLGKAALIQEVVAQVPTLTFEDLAPMTINEIALIAASKNVLSESVTQSGSASDKAYIAQKEALNTALNHAGVTLDEILKMEVEFDSKHGTMIYEVEFETAAQEGEYEINAVTGEILKSELKDRSGSEDHYGYIGTAAARDAALAHAGVAAGEVQKLEIELDSDDHVMIYQVEFETGAKKYEYEINATTGEVVSCETKDRNQTSSGDNGSEASVDSGDSNSVSYIGESAAQAAALAHAGVAESSTAYIKSYLEYKDGKPVWYCVEFKVNQTEYEYEIDLYSGAVLDCDVESHDKSDSSKDSASANADQAAYIGESAALAAALNHAGVAESSLKEKHVELDRDGNTMIYEVEFETGSEEYEYKIDAVSGAVLSAKHH